MAPGVDEKPQGVFSPLCGPEGGTDGGKDGGTRAGRRTPAALSSCNRAPSTHPVRLHCLCTCPDRLRTIVLSLRSHSTLLPGLPVPAPSSWVSALLAPSRVGPGPLSSPCIHLKGIPLVPNHRFPSAHSDSLVGLAGQEFRFQNSWPL